MLRLRTFGGLALENGTASLAGAALQRRRLSVLAVVAVAGPCGVTREKILALLWPESDERHGRQALSQSLYALRRDTSSDDLVLGGETLRLNPGVITTEPAEFTDSCARGDFERATGLYAGPFLDGVHIPAAGSFERWCEQHRVRFAEAAEHALETLATRAAARGDHHGAAVAWRRLMALNPIKTSAVVGLMKALAACGERCSALRYAEEYSRIVRAELDAEPSAEVAALATRLRRAQEIREPGEGAIAPMRPRYSGSTRTSL